MFEHCCALEAAYWWTLSAIKVPLELEFYGGNIPKQDFFHIYKYSEVTKLYSEKLLLISIKIIWLI